MNAWLEQPERGSVLAMRALVWITLKLGRRAARLLLGPACLYFIFFSRSARQSSRAYLAQVFGRPARFAQIFRHYFTFASTVHDRIYLLTGRHQYFEVTLSGYHELEAVLNEKRGCILLGSHLGSFEILRSLAMRDHKWVVNVLMYQDNAVKTNAVLSDLCPELRLRTITLGRPEALLQVKECLERGEVVGMLSDRALRSDKTTIGDFLGRPARFPLGPLRVARLLRVPTMLFFGLYRGGRRYEIYFERFMFVAKEEETQSTVQLQAWIERYARRLEHYCRLAPYNWFNFYDFWGGKP